MNSKERVSTAMDHREPDRVPVMCQLSLGHYFLHAGGGAVEIWHDTAAFGDALLAMRRRYGFDGILVNLPGRDPRWRGQIASMEQRGRDTLVHWANGAVTTAPPDDNPHVRAAGGEIRDIFFCPHHPDQACTCRKPRPGLIWAARERHAIDLSRAVMVGDSPKDIAAARAAGVRLTVLVRTGNGAEAEKALSGRLDRPDHVAADLFAAVDWIIAHDPLCAP